MRPERAPGPEDRAGRRGVVPGRAPRCRVAGEDRRGAASSRSVLLEHSGVPGRAVQSARRRLRVTVAATAAARNQAPVGAWRAERAGPVSPTVESPAPLRRLPRPVPPRRPTPGQVFEVQPGSSCPRVPQEASHIEGTRAPPRLPRLHRTHTPYARDLQTCVHSRTGRPRLRTPFRDSPWRPTEAGRSIRPARSLSAGRRAPRPRCPSTPARPPHRRAT